MTWIRQPYSLGFGVWRIEAQLVSQNPISLPIIGSFKRGASECFKRGVNCHGVHDTSIPRARGDLGLRMFQLWASGLGLRLGLRA